MAGIGRWLRRWSRVADPDVDHASIPWCRLAAGCAAWRLLPL